jgi:hypothetical protein
MTASSAADTRGCRLGEQDHSGGGGLSITARRPPVLAGAIHPRVPSAAPCVYATSPTPLALFAWLISNQPAVLFSQNKPAPAISHQQTNKPSLAQAAELCIARARSQVPVPDGTACLDLPLASPACETEPLPSLAPQGGGGEARRWSRNKSDPCGSRYIYVHDLPPRFNKAVLWPLGLREAQRLDQHVQVHEQRRPWHCVHTFSLSIVHNYRLLFRGDKEHPILVSLIRFHCIALFWSRANHE